MCRQSEHVPSPVSSTLCLGPDSAQRWAFLRRVKPQKLHDARQFFRRRTQFLDATRPFSEATQLETASGEICASKLDVFPLYGARSVKEVFDVLLFYFLNVEMCTAEINGNVVVREEAETGDESVSQNRFVFETKLGVQVEANNIIFCEYTPPTRLSGPHESSELDPSDEGLITLDFVDDDALYPYRPDSHLRDDITSVFIVKSYPIAPSARASAEWRRRGSRASPVVPPSVSAATGTHRNVRLSEPRGRESSGRSASDWVDCGGDPDRVVVLGRWVQSKFHDTTRCGLPSDVLFGLRTELDRVNDAIVVSVLDRFKEYAV